MSNTDNTTTIVEVLIETVRSQAQALRAAERLTTELAVMVEDLTEQVADLRRGQGETQHLIDTLQQAVIQLQRNAVNEHEGGMR